MARIHRIGGIAFFIAVDVQLKVMGITTPVAGLVGVLAAMLAVGAVLGDRAASTVFRALEPGYRFLVKWASLFFVPALVKLPLVWGQLGDASLLGLGALILLGFLGTFFSAAAIAGLFPATAPTGPAVTVAAPAAKAAGRVYPRPGDPFKKRWLPVYMVGMSAALVGSHLGLLSQVAAQASYMMCATLLGFAAGQALPKVVRDVFHPLFACIAASWTAAALWAAQAGPKIGFFDVLATYSAWPGAGAVLSFMLGPAVVALAMLLYERRQLIRRELVPIVCTCVASGALSLFGTALLAKLLGLPHFLGLAAVSRCVTSAIALDIAAVLHASPVFAVAMVVVTGFLGVALAPWLFKLLGMTSPRSRGLAMAASSHGLGTVSLSGTDNEAFPYSAVGFVIVGAASAAIVQVPQLRELLFYLLPK